MAREVSHGLPDAPEVSQVTDHRLDPLTEALRVVEAAVRWRDADDDEYDAAMMYLEGAVDRWRDDVARLPEAEK